MEIVLGVSAFLAGVTGGMTVTGLIYTARAQRNRLRARLGLPALGLWQFIRGA